MLTGKRDQNFLTTSHGLKDKCWKINGTPDRGGRKRKTTKILFKIGPHKN